MQNDTSEYLIDDDESVNDNINIYNFSAFFFSTERSVAPKASRPQI